MPVLVSWVSYVGVAVPLWSQWRLGVHDLRFSSTKGLIARLASLEVELQMEMRKKFTTR